MLEMTNLVNALEATFRITSTFFKDLFVDYLYPILW